MATLTWSTLPSGTYAFNPNVDVLNFNTPGISAADIGFFSSSGTVDSLFYFEGKTVTLQTSAHTITTPNVTFADQSVDLQPTGGGGPAPAPAPVPGGMGVIPPMAASGEDFNGDGRGDMLFAADNGDVALWQMNGSNLTSAALVGNASGWSIADSGDFNGDNRADVLLRASSGEVGVWMMNGTSITDAGIVATVPTSWSIAGTGDFNGDNRSDILLRADSGEVGVWMMNGKNIASSGIVATLPDAWSIAGTGDFNGDNRSDIVLQSDSGQVGVWFMNGASLSSAALAGPSLPEQWVIS